MPRTTRSRSDRCPGVLRPWPAEDGLLVRLRLIGGRVESTQLAALMSVAEQFGEPRIHLTTRTNLQVRGLPGTDSHLEEQVIEALEATGLMPTRTHELVRNVMVSPQSGLAGGRADLRGVAADLDALVCTDPVLGTLSGRFLFVLDDGRGDLIGRECDLGLVALDAGSAQLRVGTGWSEIVDLAAAASRLADLAHDFVVRRGNGPGAPWHVAELDPPIVGCGSPDDRLPAPLPPLAFGDVPGGRHVEVGPAGLDRAGLEALTGEADYLIVTPWRGVLIPKENR